MGTTIVALILAAIVGLTVLNLLKKKKAGKSSCGCGCEHCSAGCHK